MCLSTGNEAPDTQLPYTPGAYAHRLSDQYMCLSNGGGGGDLADPEAKPPTHPKPKSFPLGKNEILTREPKKRGPFYVHPPIPVPSKH